MKSPKATPAEKPAKPKKSELRREAILRHALALFDLHGFANTSLDDIARETGIKREAIYYYFKDRAEILLCIIRPQTRSLVDGLEAVVKSDADSTTKLYEAMRNHLQRFDRHCLEMTISLRDVYLDDAKEVRREMDKIWRQYERMWTQIVAEGRASGAFSEVGDPKMVAFAILGMCNWLARWYDPRKSVSVDELIETYFSMLAYGLVNKGSVKAEVAPALTGKRGKSDERLLTLVSRRASSTPR
ncbi:TetR/AcrR family transcriptional regulator [Pseudorhodoplanes sp.]|uniref:TetR/AcrR family transcriptional regulator n=1 Tax=Pseudorhodoplanes sp. TaxID=1934341 RepID=UPI003D12ACA0